MSASIRLLVAVTAADRTAPSNSLRTVSVSCVSSGDDFSNDVPRSSSSAGAPVFRRAIAAPASDNANRIFRVRPSR
ncbi:hypothetical protein [Nocardia sp. CA-120079]|uniref:hypothetical protein n=1 Tax=Nocardia sp. CA-120079 TaxID=3239974 RepID=UPI003D98BC14